MARAHASDRAQTKSRYSTDQYNSPGPADLASTMSTTSSTASRTVPSTNPDWLLTMLCLALAAARRPSTHGRAQTAQCSTTNVCPMFQLVFPTSRSTPRPASPTLRPTASLTQLSRLWVCSPHRRVLDVYPALIQEPRERGR